MGGVLDSAHTKGLAADIAAAYPRQRFKVVHGLIHVGFRRIILYKEKRIIHADMDESKPQDIITLK